MNMQTTLFNKISVIIPTYERPELIHDILYNQISSYIGSLFEIIIYDTSRDNQSEQEYSQYMKTFPFHCNVQYIRQPCSMSLSSKIKLAIETCRTPYFYISGDGIRLHYSLLEKELCERIHYELYDVLNMNSNKSFYCIKKRLHDDTIHYNNDSHRFVRETMSLMTLYGASIAKTSLFLESIKKGYFDKFFKANDGLNGYVYVSTLCENLLEHHDLNMISFYTDAMEANTIPKPAANKWVTGESFYTVGLKRFMCSINAMENLDLDDKKIVIYRYYKSDWSAFKLHHVLYLKESNALTQNLIKKYKPYLKKAGLYGTFRLASVFPSRVYFLLKALKSKAKSVYLKLRFHCK